MSCVLIDELTLHSWAVPPLARVYTPLLRYQLWRFKNPAPPVPKTFDETGILPLATCSLLSYITYCQSTGFFSTEVGTLAISDSADDAEMATTLLAGRASHAQRYSKMGGHAVETG